jgi:type I restriction enzyme S subunit
MRWPMVPLGEIAEIVGGSTPSRDVSEYWGGSIPWVTPTDLPMPGEGIATLNHTTEKITEKGLASSAANLLPVGTVLFSSRATIGKLAINEVPVATNQGFANFIPRTVVYNRYLAWTLQYHTVNIERLAGSTTFKEVTKTALKGFRIPLPAISEQRRIAEILDQADRLRRRREDADACASRILPAIFLNVFGDPAKNPKGWPTMPLRSTASKYSDGPFGSNLKSEHYVPTGIRVIRLQNIGVGVLLDDDKAYISKDHFASLAKHECRPGDVLIATLGDPNLRACIQPEWLPIALNKADCVQLRTAERIATPEYISCLLNLPSTLSMAQGLVLGQTRTRISMGRLGELTVPVPPLDLQKEFASKSQALVRLQQTSHSNARAVRDLFEAILHKAFSGDLTAKWRSANAKELLQEMDNQAGLLNLFSSNGEQRWRRA